jgi:predicted RND superfamily exporter protein
VLFSALTTVAAFGSLAASSHPGTSEMGKLLAIALGWTLLSTLLVLPALLGPARR